MPTVTNIRSNEPRHAATSGARQAEVRCVFARAGASRGNARVGDAGMPMLNRVFALERAATPRPAASRAIPATVVRPTRPRWALRTRRASGPLRTWIALVALVALVALWSLAVRRRDEEDQAQRAQSVRNAPSLLSSDSLVCRLNNQHDYLPLCESRAHLKPSVWSAIAAGTYSRSPLRISANDE